MATKKFSDRPATATRVDFDLTMWDGDKPTDFNFAAYPAIDAFALAKVNKLIAVERTTLDALPLMRNAIRAQLDDSDGTPSDWEPVILPAEARVPDDEVQRWPGDEPVQDAETGDVELDDDATPQFVAPDGTVHPLTDAGKYTELTAGSSRRRWIELMDGDNNLIVEAKTITKVWRWLVGEAAGRPSVR